MVGFSETGCFKMNIGSEIEKLISQRDEGHLSQDEFENAKALLLSQENANNATNKNNSKSSHDKQFKRQYLISVLSTLAAALSGASAVIAPSLMKVIILTLFVIAATLNWVGYSNLHKKSERQ